MNPITRFKNKLRGLTQSYGPGWLKRWLWNREFSAHDPRLPQHTQDNDAYAFIRKYCSGRALLDMGCGWGNVLFEAGCNFDIYTGVDVSSVAIEAAERRGRNHARFAGFFCSDYTSFHPTENYDVILFRDSIQYVSRPKVAGLLQRLSERLNTGGVFIFRFYEKTQGWGIINTVERVFSIVEFKESDHGSLVIVLRPR